MNTGHVVTQSKTRLGDGQKERVIESIAASLRARPELVFAYVHGSFLGGDFRDVDIAVYLNEGLAHEGHAALSGDLGRQGPSRRRYDRICYELDLEVHLERLSGLPVDVRVLNGAPPSFRFSVIKSGALLFCRDDALRCDFECATFVEYHDVDYLRRTYRREALGLGV